MKPHIRMDKGKWIVANMHRAYYWGSEEYQLYLKAKHFCLRLNYKLITQE